MSLLPRVAVTGAGHLGSRPTDKEADKYAAKYAVKHADAAVFEVAAGSNTSADSASATAQDLDAAACASLPAVIPAMNANSPVVSSSRHYKIAAEFLEAGIRYFAENYLRPHYLCGDHLRRNPVTESPGAATDLPATDIILHLIDSPVGQLAFNGELPLHDRINSANIDNECANAENNRPASLNTNNSSLETESGLPTFMRRGRHQLVQGLSAAIRGWA